MNARPYVLAETNWKTVQETAYQVAVLPWGATEAHNYHLPYATDNIQVEAIAEMAAEWAWNKGSRVVVLPNIPFGVNTGQMDIKLCMNLNPSTQLAILNDLVEVLASHDITKLVILNGHGGNDFKQMIRELALNFPEITIVAVNWFQVMKNQEYFDEPGDHAGEMETSLVMQLRPEWVLPLTEAGDGAERKFKVHGLKQGWAKTQRAWTTISADTGVGNPSLSSAEKGNRFLQALQPELGRFLVELAAAGSVEDLYE